MRARDLWKKRPGVRIKVESETEERREREIRFSSPASHVWGPRAFAKISRRPFHLAKLILRKNPTVFQSTNSPIKNYTHPDNRIQTKTYAPFIWREIVPGTRVTIPAESTKASGHWRKKVDPFIPSKSWQRCSHLDRVDPAWRVSMFMWRKVGPAARVTLPSNKGDPEKRVTLLSNKGDPEKRVNPAVK